jgi:hypothetical protein
MGKRRKSIKSRKSLGSSDLQGGVESVGSGMQDGEGRTEVSDRGGSAPTPPKEASACCEMGTGLLHPPRFQTTNAFHIPTRICRGVGPTVLYHFPFPSPFMPAGRYPSFLPSLCSLSALPLLTLHLPLAHICIIHPTYFSLSQPLFSDALDDIFYTPFRVGSKPHRF